MQEEVHLLTVVIIPLIATQLAMLDHTGFCKKSL